MNSEVRLMSTVIERERVRQFGSMIDYFINLPEDEEIKLQVRDIKAIMNVVRDFIVMTQINGEDVGAAAALEYVANFVDHASPQVFVRPSFYKTTALALIFEVSVTAINKWIEEGRFVGYKRKPGEHAKIPHFTFFKLRDGSLVTLGSLVEEYHDKQTSFADADEQQLLIEELKKLMEKYDAKSYDQAFGSGPISQDQESDASWWLFYEARLDKLNG
jgi:hypothetical protein